MSGVHHLKMLRRCLGYANDQLEEIQDQSDSVRDFDRIEASLQDMSLYVAMAAIALTRYETSLSNTIL